MLVLMHACAYTGCFYSTALSQSCRSINGDSKCEIVKKIFRQCPGMSKVRGSACVALSSLPLYARVLTLFGGLAIR